MNPGSHVIMEFIFQHKTLTTFTEGHYIFHNYIYRCNKSSDRYSTVNHIFILFSYDGATDPRDNDILQCKRKKKTKRERDRVRREKERERKQTSSHTMSIFNTGLKFSLKTLALTRFTLFLPQYSTTVMCKFITSFHLHFTLF